MQKYCKAYHLADLRKFPSWKEVRKNWKPPGNSSTSKTEEAPPKELADDHVVFLHDDFSVTESMWHKENVIFDDVTAKWKKFCRTTLSFEIPEDLRTPAADSGKEK